MKSWQLGPLAGLFHFRLILRPLRCQYAVPFSPPPAGLHGRASQLRCGAEWNRMQRNSRSGRRRRWPIPYLIDAHMHLTESRETGPDPKADLRDLGVWGEIRRQVQRIRRRCRRRAGRHGQGGLLQGCGRQSVWVGRAGIRAGTGARRRPEGLSTGGDARALPLTIASCPYINVDPRILPGEEMAAHIR